MDIVPEHQQKKFPIIPVVAVIFVVAVIGIFSFVFLQAPASPAGDFLVSAPLAGDSVGAVSGNGALDSIGMQSDVIDPSQFISREDYFREVFMPRREQYVLFEKTAVFLKRPVSEIPAYFGLASEQEIFAALPPVPNDFSEIAYLLAQGKYFNLASLDERYFKQPEFYPNFKTLGITYWTRPDPKYWVSNGYGSYPSEQWDSLERGSREEFRGVVFFYSSWGAQTFQGISLMPDAESQKYFDIQISPKNFLLEPSFTKFGKDWVYRVEITGKLKPGTPSGEYAVGVNVEIPPKELRDKWSLEHKNLYFDGASAIRPSGNQIQFNVTVK